MSDPVLIWGAGAIGGVLGAYLARGGVDVRMVDIVAEHARICSNEGLSIEGPVDTFRQVVPTVTPEEVTGSYRRIVLAVKAHATEAAMTALLPHLDEGGFVLSAQNGLNEKVIARMAGPERCMGALVNYSADWLEPGRILFGNRGKVAVGEIDGTIRPRTREMHALVRMFEPEAELTDAIWDFIWGKLGYSAMLYATALTPESMADNFADPSRGATFIALGREVMRVALAEGAAPRPFNGFEPAAFVLGAGEAEARACLAQLVVFNTKTAKTHSGVWRDLAVRKRRTDVDRMVGAVADLAATHAIDTPVLHRLRELIHDIEDGRRQMSSATFDALSERVPA